MQNKNKVPDDEIRLGMIALRIFVLVVLSIDLMLAIYSNDSGVVKAVLFLMSLALIKFNISWFFIAGYIFFFGWKLLTV